MGKVIALAGGRAQKHSGERVAPAHPLVCVGATALLHPRTSVSSYKKSYNDSSDSTSGVGGENSPEREVQTAFLREHKQRRSAGFLKGPVPLSVLAAAGALPGQALLVLLAIRYRVDVTARPWVNLPASVMREFGFDRFTKRRALAALENAGLIRVQRAKGRSTTVQLASA
jgi:hypothetical protein